MPSQAYQIDNFTKVSSESLQKVYQTISDIVRLGSFVIWHPIPKSKHVLGLKTLNPILYEQLTSSDLSNELKSQQLLSLCFVGLDYIQCPLYEEALSYELKAYLTELIILQHSACVRLTRFVTAHVSNGFSRSLWFWYKFNSQTRPFNDSTEVESLFCYYHSITDSDEQFANFRFVASLFSKKAAEIKTSSERKFAQIDGLSGSGPSDSEMKGWIEKELQNVHGDPHIDAIRTFEEGRMKKYQEEVKSMQEKIRNKPVGITGGIKWF